MYSPPKKLSQGNKFSLSQDKENFRDYPICLHSLGNICYSLPVSSVLKIIVHFLIIVLGEMLYLVSIILFCLEVELLLGNFLINRLYTSRKKKNLLIYYKVEKFRKHMILYS